MQGHAHAQSPRHAYACVPTGAFHLSHRNGQQLASDAQNAIMENTGELVNALKGVCAKGGGGDGGWGRGTGL